MSDTSLSGVLVVGGHRQTLGIRDLLGQYVGVAVVDDARAAELAGKWITATGTAVLGHRGQAVGLVDATVERLQMPSWTAPSLDAVDFSRSPLTGGVEGVDEDEVAAYLELIGQGLRTPGSRG